MEPESGKRYRFSLKGSAGLIVAVAVVAVLLIALGLSLVFSDQRAYWGRFRGRAYALAQAAADQWSGST